jgi:hypothetical protein
VAGQEIPLMEREAVSTMCLSEIATHQPHHNMVSQAADSNVKMVHCCKNKFIIELCNVGVNIFMSVITGADI